MVKTIIRTSQVGSKRLDCFEYFSSLSETIRIYRIYKTILNKKIKTEKCYSKRID